MKGKNCLAVLAKRAFLIFLLIFISGCTLQTEEQITENGAVLSGGESSDGLDSGFGETPPQNGSQVVPAQNGVSGNSSETSGGADLQAQSDPAPNGVFESGSETSGGAGSQAQSNPPEIDYQKVKPYEVGRITVIMYHGVVDAEEAPDKYTRTVEEFKADLQTLYDEGFRLVSMRDYLDNNIKIEAGKSPVVLTFDDGLRTSFSLVKNEDGILVPRPDCAVDLINKFAELHPDFGKTAAFFINRDPFAGDASLAQSFAYLVENGYEIGNHTASHAAMDELDALQLQAEIGEVEKIIRENAPKGYECVALTYPFGIRPKEEFHSFALSGEFEGIKYNYAAAFREGQSVSPSAPNRNGFDVLNLPRVRGSDNEETDLGWTLRSFRDNPDLKYVSDGDPNKISVPEVYAENIDYASVSGKEVVVYELSG
ncbi:MAG: polysaccharide deacetylase family protein [Clostridiales bacterium]|jgi:peptidoglycan/xylan/chitin deacetylase (PgdA/CDA1 family)|nr:polysaccharide deacetylase family protein [Clostridiales bacterium]